MDHFKKILMLRFQNITIGYSSEFFSIKKLDLERGKLYTLFGRNGIGKTTFFNTLCKFIPLKEGDIYIEQQNLKSIQNPSKFIAFVPSRFEGVQHLSAYDYIALGRSPHTNFLGTISQQDKDSISNAITLLEIDYLMGKDTNLLSDGERQICSIAKALVQETPVILLDEPSAFLDYQNKMKVLEVVKKIAFEKNICIIQSSHDLDLSLDFSDDFLVVNPLEKVLKHFPKDKISKEAIIREAFG